jgi:hypothetical protein
MSFFIVTAVKTSNITWIFLSSDEWRETPTLFDPLEVGSLRDPTE